ncbi:MAG TPA: UDP-glucose/GDP-mannose dehydrogenase family protein [Gammaproteobacteria bacterium]
MRISVFGLGYVGVVSAACLARNGHVVVGVDTNCTKVALVNDGASPIVEKGLDALLRSAADEGRLRATTDAAEAVLSTDLSLVCVGTPGNGNGSLNLAFVERVCRDIGSALARVDGWRLVTVRSTMLPGSMRNLVIPTLEQASGKRAGEDFGVCFNPEFLREGSAVQDFDDPPKTVIGEIDERSGDVLASLYEHLRAPLFRTDLGTAEMVKYVDNAWHALKVVFANEIGNICKTAGVDSHAVMDIFCRDTKLNLSPSYLKPGFAFGGSCLPKDVRALTHYARSNDVDTPVLSSILASNELQVRRVFNMLQSYGRRRVGVLGMSFKAGTDDLRESPLVALIELLIGKGYELTIYDRNVSLAKLIGANRDYILEHIPHIEKLMVDDPCRLLERSDILVVGTAEAEFSSILRNVSRDTVILDLVRVDNALRERPSYQGICW